jgi:hypothetical protein
MMVRIERGVVLMTCCVLMRGDLSWEEIRDIDVSFVTTIEMFQ